MADKALEFFLYLQYILSSLVYKSSCSGSVVKEGDCDDDDRRPECDTRASF